MTSLCIVPVPAVLFIVEAEYAMYESEFGGDVVMGCRFRPELSSPRAYLKVTWHQMSSPARQVYWMENWEERQESQEYRGRVKLIKEELQDGMAKLQVNTILSYRMTYKLCWIPRLRKSIIFTSPLLSGYSGTTAKKGQKTK